MASEQTFDIAHPEMILVGQTSVRIYTVKEGDLHEKWHDASLMLMETIEPLDVPVKRAIDGEAGVMNERRDLEPFFSALKPWVIPDLDRPEPSP